MKRKRTSVFCVLALLAVLLPVPARADMGPKPSMTIHVENPPSGIYYLDLLVPGEAPDELLQALAQLRDVYRVAYLPAAEENASCEQ